MAEGFSRREIGRDGVRLSYLDNDAAGPVVMLLHGLAGAGDAFTATASAMGGRYRFVLPDLRGHGASTRRPADLSRAAFTSDVAALIGHVSPGRPVILAGQSMGGQTAILVAAAHPGLVERLVLLEANAAGGADPARIGTYFRSWPLPFASAEAALEFLGDDALSRSWVAHLEPAEGGGLVTDALAMAMAIAHGHVQPGAIFHSDRGAQYTSSEFSRFCQAKRVRASVGRTGVCWDNAAAESFFGALKNEMYYRQAFPTRARARFAIADYIEVFYNRQRLHSALRYRTPLEAFKEFQAAATAA